LIYNDNIEFTMSRNIYVDIDASNESAAGRVTIVIDRGKDNAICFKRR